MISQSERQSVGKTVGKGMGVLALGMGLCALTATAQTPGDQGSPFPAGNDSGLAGASQAAAPAADPPARVVRLSVLRGDVSAEPSSVNTFSPAELNQVFTSGDRVYTDANASAELQAGQVAIRLGGGTDLTVTAMTDTLAQFGLASGAAHLRSFAVPAGTVLELDTAEAAVTVLQPGDLRVEEDPTSHATTIAVIAGQAQVDGPGLSQVLNAGDRVRVHGSDPELGQNAFAEPLPPTDPDALDGFSGTRDTAYADGAQASSDYLNPETTGSADLAANGTWSTDGDVGPVWYPVVTVGWRPYLYGHWRWVAPWGWTWVGAEPWGFAPFHYGRWLFVDGRWGWVPGVPALHSVYAPALVTFVGGNQFSASLGYAAGSGLAAWFPLGPREPYAPWYHGSTGYLNRVNASNIYDPNTAQARAFYNQRAVSVFSGNPASGERSYANRLSGTVVVSQSSFAAGQSAIRNQVSIPASALAEAPLLTHPVVSPERTMVSPAAARVVPPSNAHRVLQSQAHNTVVPGTESSAVLANRPTFLHGGTAPMPHPSFEEQRRVMDRAEPGRPLPAPANPPSGRPAYGPAERPIPHPAPPASRPAPAPAASSLHGSPK